MPEIACYSREAAGDRAVIVDALRMPLMSLWTGVRIERNGDDTMETHTGPFPTSALAAQHAASGQLAAPETWHSDTLGRVTIPTD